MAGEFKLKSIKSQLILYLICFAVFLSIRDKNIAFLLATITAIISCLAAESTILYFKTKVFQMTESPVITGLIIGFVLSSDEPIWKFVLASLLAIISKYLIRFRKKHLFNPAAFGLFLTLIFFSASTQWEGTYLWYIILPFGLYFVHKIRKIEIIIGYAVVSLGLFGIQALFQKVGLLNIFGYLSYFYIFVMIVEPKTTPIKTKGKFIFGSGIAVFISILTNFGARFDVELLSLLLMNITVPLLNKFFLKKEV